MNSGFWTRLQAWINQPFTSQMNALDWALFLGFVIVVAGAWIGVLRFIKEDI